LEDRQPMGLPSTPSRPCRSLQSMLHVFLTAATGADVQGGLVHVSVL
jgi:hypothetical protein